MKIRTKATWLLLFLFLIPFVILGMISYRTVRRTVQENLGLSFQHLAYQIADRIDGELHGLYQNIQTWVELDFMQEVLSGDLDGRILSFLKEQHKEHLDFSSLSVLNGEGEIVASTDLSLIGRRTAQAEYFYKAMEGAPYSADISPEGKAWDGTVTFAFPIRSKFEKNKVIGVLHAGWQTKALSDMLRHFQGVDGDGRRFHITVLRRDGLVIIASETNGKAAFRRNWIQEGIKSAVLAGRGQEGYGIEAGERNKKFLTGFNFSRGYEDFPGFGWVVLVQEDIKTIFASIDRLRGMIYGAWAVMGVCVGIGLWLALRKMSGPIVELSIAAARVAQGDLKGDVAYRWHDEVGALVESFNRMVHDLNAQRAQLVDKDYLDSIISNMADFLIVFDEEGVIRMVNPAALKLLGYVREELLGQSESKILYLGETGEDFFGSASFQKLMREGSIYDVNLTCAAKEGEKIPVVFSASVLYRIPSAYGSVAGTPAGGAAQKPGIPWVVGIGRDMRHIGKLLNDLNKANIALEELSKGLEEKVKERTAALEENQKAMLNLMEDVVESRDQLLKTNIELSKAKDALEQFSKTLEEKVKARTFELSVLYELSNAISYTLDYRRLLRIIMESLDRIVPHEVSASLIFDKENADITVRPRYPSCLKFVDEVKTILIDSAELMTGIDMSKRQVVSYIMTPEPAETETMDAVRSFFNIPFFVRGKMIGLIHVSSHKEDAFGQDDIRLMYTIANQASTAIEKLQTVIKAEKSKMESMVESMTEGVIMIDERGEAVVLNPRARQMLDFAPDLEVSARMLDHKFRAVGLHETLKECQKKDGLVSKEIVIPQEKDLVLKCDMVPVRDEEGKTIGIAMILIDVTKERELKRLKDEFVSTVSHELRTPLSISTEGINLVLDGITGAVSEQQKEILQTAKDNLSRLAAIINDLLDISKIEAGKISLNRRLIDFGSLVEHFAGVYQKVLSTKKQTIEVSLPSAPFLLYADRDKIIQVLTNLLNNAHKFTPEGGKIEVVLAVQDGQFLCSVKDNGPGITQEDMAKLFSKFEQFGRTYGPGMKGTGLGLSIAKALVELHGGKIWAESRPGEGTSFLFTLPSYETVRTDFNSHLDRVLEEALASRQPVSLMMVHLRNHEIIQKRYGERILHDIMDIIEGVAGKIVSKPADRFILYDVHTICAVLPATNKTGVLAVIRRFKEAIKTCVFPIEEKGDLEIAFGLALYPLQGKDREGLVKAAQEDVTRKRRILVVDDNPEIHSVLQANFADQEALLEPALDGQEALDKIHKKIPDLIILDIMLPKMNGYELLGRLKHDPRTASIPIVILTAKEKGDVEREFKDFEEIPIIGKVGGFEKIVAMAKELL